MYICELCGSTHSSESDVCSVCISNIKASKKEVISKHVDSKMKAADLLAKAKRLVASQEYAIEKYGNEIDTTESALVVKMGKKLFAKKATKFQLLSLITANSNASRNVNNQLQK